MPRFGSGSLAAANDARQFVAHYQITNVKTLGPKQAGSWLDNQTERAQCGFDLPLDQSMYFRNLTVAGSGLRLRAASGK